MRTVILLACLICACDARRVKNLAKEAKGKIVQADNTATAPWESNNLARYSSAAELNDAELGLANLMDAVRDPSALSQIVQMLRDPESLAEVQQLMASSSFAAQATWALERSTDAPFQEGGSKAGVRESELEKVANHTAGNISLAELGAANLLAAMRDPSVTEAAVQMLRNPDNVAAVKKMSSLESFQQEAEHVAKEMDKFFASADEHVPQSFAQVSEAKVQDGLEASISPIKPLALAWGLLASNPVAAFSMHANRPLSRVARPSRAAISMQANPTDSEEAAPVAPIHSEEAAPVAMSRQAPTLAAVLAGSRGAPSCEPELAEVLMAAAEACARVSQALRTATIDAPTGFSAPGRDGGFGLGGGGLKNVQGETQKGMDVVANEIFKDALRGKVAAMASEEEEGVIFLSGEEGGDNGAGFGQSSQAFRYEVAFDPLDGSSNLDSNLPTGSIFGVYAHSPGDSRHFRGSARRTLVAAGYALYSSSTELVLSLPASPHKPPGGGGSAGSTGSACRCMGFTLDPGRGRFVLSRRSLACPARGPYYSLNDAREPDWPAGLRRWVNDAKRGATPSATRYSSRYVCALVADVHRTLLTGGWAGNPRPHLRLLYEAAPLAHIAEACGGAASDGVRDLLDIEPAGLHDRTPVFIGSRDDVAELVAYGDVQQKAASYGA